MKVIKIALFLLLLIAGGFFAYQTILEGPGGSHTEHAFDSFLQGSGTASDSSQKEDVVVATIQEKKIMSSQLEQEMQRRPEAALYAAFGKSNPAFMNQFKYAVLNQMIDRELLLNQARKEVSLSEEEITEQVDKRIAEYGDQQDLDLALTKMNLTRADFRNQLAESLEINAYIEKKFADKINVSDQDAKSFFEQNEGQFAQKESVRARHILLKLNQDAADADVKAAEEKIKNIREEAIAEGADFAALAEKYSEGPTAPKGGDLGFFPRGAMVPEFESVAFELQAGAISQPVRTQFGYHLIKVEEKKDAVAADFEQAKPQIVNQLMRQKAGQLIQAEAQGLRESGQVEILMEKPEAPQLPMQAGQPQEEQAEQAG